MLSLSSGRTSAKTSSIPRSRATASATGRASPVIITTRTPRSLRAATASAASGRMLILKRQGADDLPITHDVKDRGAAVRPGGCLRAKRGRHGQTALAEHGRPADRHLTAPDRCLDPASGDRPKP